MNTPSSRSRPVLASARQATELGLFSLSIVAVLVRVSIETAFIRSTSPWLPRTLRVRSIGFASLVAMYFAAGFVRHVAINDHAAASYALSLTLGLAAPAALLRRRPAAIAVFLAASIGVDLMVGGFELVFGESSMSDWASFIWEVVAGLLCSLELWIDDAKAQAAAEAQADTRTTDAL